MVSSTSPSAVAPPLPPTLSVPGSVSPLCACTASQASLSSLCGLPLQSSSALPHGPPVCLFCFDVDGARRARPYGRRARPRGRPASTAGFASPQIRRRREPYSCHHQPPGFFVWVDVLGWLRSGLNRAGRSSILCVLRTVEPGGRQVFWLKMATVRDAAVLRGVMGGRVVADSPELRVHFVHHDLYSARTSVFYDAWSPRHGMEIGNRPGYRASLFDRLALPDPGSRPASLPAPEDPGHRFLHEAPEPEPQPVTDEDRRRRRTRRR